MGYKNVCLNCLRVENLGTDYENFRTGNCPECSSEMIFVNHKFRPPKKNDKKRWELVKFLIARGFNFQSVSDENGIYVTYPQSIEEAKEFVKKYEFRAIKN
tara:strand:- start:47 stop:349 length:303 start_codon:yes stop_codon:yes gene_type:complete